MPKLKKRDPKNCRDRNQAFSWHNGKRIYHGTWGTPEAKKNYRRFCDALDENPGLPLQTGKVGGVLVSELAAGFLSGAESRVGKIHGQHFTRAVGYLVDIYGDLAVSEFSPKKLKAVRKQMVKGGTLCRRMVNDYTGRIVRIFAWGVEEEVITPNIVAALREVKSLRKGEEGTFDNPPREEVPDDIVRRTLPFMSPTVAVMVMIQRMTGMRPSELCMMTVADIDKTRVPGLWHYVPKSQKTEEYIGAIPIPLGLPEQALLIPHLEGKKPSEAVFSPRTAVKEMNERRRAERKTKVTPSQMERDQRRAENPAHHIGEFYDRNSYRKAVGHAIKQANKVLPEDQKIPKWSPYQLRHAQATDLEKNEGLDVAQAVLRHTTANTTKRYAHGQLAIAEDVARNRRNPFATGGDE